MSVLVYVDEVMATELIAEGRAVRYIESTITVDITPQNQARELARNLGRQMGEQMGRLFSGKPEKRMVWDGSSGGGVVLEDPAACSECTSDACSRIGQCLRFKCAYGQVNKP